MGLYPTNPDDALKSSFAMLRRLQSLNEDRVFYTQIRNHKISLTKVDLPFVEHRYRR